MSYGMMCNSSTPVELLPDECFHMDLSDERANGVGEASFCSMDMEVMASASL